MKESGVQKHSSTKTPVMGPYWNVHICLSLSRICTLASINFVARSQLKHGTTEPSATKRQMQKEKHEARPRRKKQGILVSDMSKAIMRNQFAQKLR